MRRTIGWIAVIARYLFIISMALAIIVGVLVYLVAADSQNNRYLSLLMTIVITVGSIFVAATFATMVHKWFAEIGGPVGMDPSVGYGEVFYRYVIRFAWIISPLAGGYALLTIIEVLR